ncbi:MAG: cytochrome b N-terminal domain-containing protein [Candidatus Electrothrix sp. GW3-4]|uniref:cytochrome b N-terminal domain-containing protein n=1 Tax=Candidatus Electrothrix sp. GW3-4 TaxID=3126740 RepID=UPI0030CD5C62
MSTTPDLLHQKQERLTERLQQRLFSIRWGGHALISLYISVLSGLIVGLQYNAAEPFYSTATIELIVPFGSFWRSLHYFSSQAFMLLLLVHLFIILWQKAPTPAYRFTRGTWLRLTASVPVALTLLFTGYILRGDATGEAAGAIAENITQSLPILGTYLNKILFDSNAVGVQKVYLNHLIGLMVVGGFCVWSHLRRYTVSWRNHLPLTLFLLLLAPLFKTPLERDHFGLLHINGPWFFVGLQELLRYLPVFWAGIFVPATFVGALLLLPQEGRARRVTFWFMGAWLLVYTVLSVMGFLRG